MLEQLHVDQKKNPAINQRDNATAGLDAELISAEYIESAKHYNANILDIDDSYKTIRPVNDVLVRVFIHEPKVTESGLVRPFKQTVPVPTQNGMAEFMEASSPFPYTNKAVVIRQPDYQVDKKLEGKTVLLNRDIVRAVPMGRAMQVSFNIPTAFWADCELTEPPIDPAHKDYGYLLVPNSAIKAIIG